MSKLIYNVNGSFRNTQPCWLMNQQGLDTSVSYYEGKDTRFKYEGYRNKFLKWNETEGNDEDIYYLELRPNDKSTDTLPKCIQNLKNLETLIIPIWFLPNLTPDQLPPSVKVLVIGTPLSDKSQARGLNKVDWRKDIQFPNIEQLELKGGGIYSEMFPNIKYLNLSSKFYQIQYSEIVKLEKLKNIIVSGIECVENLNEFKDSKIKRLSIVSSNITNFEGILGFENVEILELRHLKKLKSLMELERLKKLGKIDVFNCNQLLDIGKLYNSETVECFKLLECGKKWIDTLGQNKIGFEQKNFKVYFDDWRAFSAYLNEAETKWMYL